MVDWRTYRYALRFRWPALTLLFDEGIIHSTPLLEFLSVECNNPG